MSGRAIRSPAGIAAAALAIAAFATGAPATASAATLPPQGIYESCNPGTSSEQTRVCVDHLAMIRDAGFEIVLNPSAFYGSPDQVRAYAAAADRLRLRIIWPLHHRNLYTRADVSRTFPVMAQACGCASARDLIPFMIDVVKDAPATFMYYVGDETPLELHDTMAANSRLVAQSDPWHPRFFVSKEFSDFGANLQPFGDDADVLAGDSYPIGLTGRVQDVADATRAVQRIADAHGRQSAMVLQAFSWRPYFIDGLEHWPTAGEYRTMRDLALTSGRPRFILWWSAFNILRSDEPERRWSDFVRGAMAPPPADPLPAVTASPPPPLVHEPVAPPATVASPPATVAVRALSLRRRGRTVRLRFALTAPARTAISVRSAGRLRTRTVLGGVALRTVRVRAGSRARRVVIRIAPLGGRGVRVVCGAGTS